MHKSLRVMRATETEGVELAAYRLKGVAYSWFELWDDSRDKGSPPSRWSESADAFMDHFLPAETRAAHAAEFENLKQGSKSVWEYHMEFVRMSKYAILMLPAMEAKVRRFVQGLSPLVINKAATAPLNSDMNYGKMVAFAQAIENQSEQLPESFSVSTSVGETIMVARVYRGCVVMVHGRYTVADLIELLMVDFDGSESKAEKMVELCKDYDIDILYHPGKANVVADALSQKSMGSLAHLEICQRSLAREVHQLASLGVRLADSSEGGVIVQNMAESLLVVEVKEKQYDDPLLLQLKEGIHKHKTMAFTLGMDDGNTKVEEATWENEEEMKKTFPYLFE
ncbi:uncharacterized protein [Nicotiana tomentosiformis]|uniref:uncharacterized protein n=1 Tax=Nicotiana tomentosiformis TaxID=4098 RepID=UPI00388C3C30